MAIRQGTGTRTPPVAQFLWSESEQGADMLHITRFRAPDPFACLVKGGRISILLSDLEIDRGRREAAVDEVVSWSEIEAKLAGRTGTKPSRASVLATFLKARSATRCSVPSDFPLGLACELADHGIKAIPCDGMFRPERQIKSRAEIDLMTGATRITEAGMERGFDILRSAVAGRGRLLRWGGSVLTSERLRTEIESAILRAGGIPAGNSIVAGGLQACDPHERGHGPLRGGELIILDLFPRARSGYYGDLTRTVVKGRASDAQARLWEVCLLGQKLALGSLRAGADGGEIHREVTEFFSDNGYPTGRVSDAAGGERWSGFFHGTGHGLGLDLHEEPRFGAGRLASGQVFTIEPGLYIPGLGGVRHEDVALITARGHRLLSRCPKPMEL